MKNAVIALVVACGLARIASAQQTGPDPDSKYALGNAPYSNAQPSDGRSVLPFNPVSFRTDFRPFAAADISDYGNGGPQKSGYFFSAERLYWSFSKPSTADVGSAQAEGFYDQTLPADPERLVFEQNSLDTDFLKSEFGWGNRYELGFMDTNDYGWLIGILSHVSTTQDTGVQNATVLFDDPNGFLGPDFQDANLDGIDDDLDGDLFFGRDGLDVDFPHDGIPDLGILLPGIPPVRLVDEGDKVRYIPRFDAINVSNHTEVNGLEVMRVYRAPRLHDGGTFDMLYGARLLEIQDLFGFFGKGGIFEETLMFNQADNRIVGPQIGGRYSHRNGRWTFSAEGRFAPSVNFISIHQKSRIASLQGYSNDRPVAPEQGDIVPDPDNPPPAGPPGDLTPTVPNPFNGMRAFGSEERKDEETFAPLLELRLQTTYQFTRAVGLKIGYTAMYVDGLARASNTLEFSVPKPRVIERTDQDAFIQGLSLGFEVNR